MASAAFAFWAASVWWSGEAKAKDCDRACLFGIVEQYLAAMVAHDPSQAPLAKGARYTENGQELVLPDGLWRIATGLGDYRLFVAEPEAGLVGGFAVVLENEAPVVLALRLKVKKRRIAEMEAVVARREPAGFAEPEALKLRPEFDQVLPEAQRRKRGELIAIADSYFSALENNDGSRVPPFGEDCNRIENGVQTTNNPNNTLFGGGPGPAQYSCEKAFSLGYYWTDSRIHYRRWLIVDEARGLVFAGALFDHDSARRTFTLTDGREVKAGRTYPWTWQIMELFKIKDGRIGPIEAVVVPVPYGMDPGW